MTTLETAYNAYLRRWYTLRRTRPAKLTLEQYRDMSNDLLRLNDHLDNLPAWQVQPADLVERRQRMQYLLLLRSCPPRNDHRQVATMEVA